MKVINIFGAPGAGKSTAAMGLVHEMKKRYHKGEYISEFAKDLLWSGNKHLMVQQNLVLAEQAWRQERLRQHGIDFAVTDSPLMLSSYYGNLYRPDLPQCFHDWVRYSFDQFENINYFIHRSHPYEPEGRLQNEEESDAIANDLLYFLRNQGIEVLELKADDSVPLLLLEKLGLNWFHHPKKS